MIGIPGQTNSFRFNNTNNSFNGAGRRRRSDAGHAGMGSGGRHSSGGAGGLTAMVPLFLRRLFRYPHMDFQVDTLCGCILCAVIILWASRTDFFFFLKKKKSLQSLMIVCTMADGLLVHIAKDSVRMAAEGYFFFLFGKK